jgi:hypothetical protein
MKTFFFSVAAALLTPAAMATTVTVVDAFRFIRTDTYAESGGVIDNGTFVINGPSSPTGGLAATGVFASTLENSAAVSTASGSASATAHVTIDSDYTLVANELRFDVAAQLSMNQSASGDGVVTRSAPDPNCCRSFAFLNTFVEFDVADGAAAYSISGSPATSDVNFTLRLFNLTTLTEVSSGITGAGTLLPGRYRYTALQSLQNGVPIFHETSQFDLAFSVSPVPLPAALWLLVSGLAGLVATTRRRRSARRIASGFQ